MSRIISMLREEHRNIARLLGVLEQELGVFDRRERPDYEIFQAIIQYFKEYPESCHHPKEDVVYQILKERNRAVAGAVGDVEAEHEIEGERLRKFAAVVDQVLADQELPRQTFHEAAKDFIEHQRRHMAKEEQLLFPAALETLTADDWKRIDSRIDERKDPMFDGETASKFENLHNTILRWEKETEEQRQKMAAPQG
ncbi:MULTISPECIES: hemerythrin domain-containing protein [Rhodopseudomonas]|uniref:Hemerythrin n=1 Tax=Rhodopseudomonas palustris TaxID=1076 RepID=A0A0D7F335_RHOPL|nr:MULTISPECIES: hemerythrin domain-containing protein [Rhodopseudomonas]KIZ47508.1 hemerythrin [Rhodopseudomonas palustris]MDF3811695.1 hemerythrin domain-containing protein [Rhodopseudomonas sp. BAL398]WOK17916.1 hemerythrin domain-containing protein [Rhodopseudomonas sp. BAL398]